MIKYKLIDFLIKLLESLDCATLILLSTYILSIVAMILVHIFVK